MTAPPVFDYQGEYDENWPLPERLTLEQYSRVFFRPDAHFIDGQIIPRNRGDSIHSHIIGYLIGELYQACEAAGLRSCISLRLQISPTRIRVCDFVILKADAPREPMPTAPPLLCVEVLAPDQKLDTERGTVADYLAMGAENIWLIHPAQRIAYIFDAAGLHEADPTKLTVLNTPIRIDLTDAFEAIS